MTFPPIFSLDSEPDSRVSTCSQPISLTFRALSECFATCVPTETRAVLTRCSPLPQPLPFISLTMSRSSKCRCQTRSLRLREIVFGGPLKGNHDYNAFAGTIWSRFRGATKTVSHSWGEGGWRVKLRQTKPRNY